jgi:hypothetical protein
VNAETEPKRINYPAFFREVFQSFFFQAKRWEGTIEMKQSYPNEELAP